MRVVFLGSGSFGLPTLERLLAEHSVALVVTQPDRPAGRRRHPAPTPVGRFAEEHGLEAVRAADVNDPALVERIRKTGAGALVVVAFGQKIGKALLDGHFAVNLHGSLLPRYRGAAPVSWAMINGESETGVSVIRMTEWIDAGDVLAQRATAIDPMETAGELATRLSALGPDIVMKTLSQLETGRLRTTPQDEALACAAPKLSKSDGTVCFDQAARPVQRRIHGLVPWPGCTVRLDGRTLKLLRVQVIEDEGNHGDPGLIRADGAVACRPGSVRLLTVQPPGGTSMSFDAYCHGHPPKAGSRLEPR